MTLSRNIIRDLLPVYLAGEASDETRAAVEEFLRTDAELAQQVELARRGDLPQAPQLPAAAEKRALDRTRRHLRWRMFLFGLAAYVTSLPVSVTFSSAGYEGLLVDTWPERTFLLLLAGGLWVLYWRVSRRLHVTGL